MEFLLIEIKFKKFILLVKIQNRIGRSLFDIRFIYIAGRVKKKAES